MRKWASTSAKSVLMAAGFVALGSGVAFADTDAATSGNGSVLGGNQAVLNADVPVNVTGNAVGAVAGMAGASSTGSDAKVIDHHHDEVHTSGNGSVLGGNQLVVDGDVPVNVTGNAIGAVGGVAGASSTGSDSKVLRDGHGHKHDDPEVATSGNGSLIGGNQLVGDLDVPVNVSGNAIGAVGGVAGAAATDADAIVREHQSAPVQHQSGQLTATDVVTEAVENASLLPDTSGVDAGVLRQSAPVREHQSIATSGNGSALGGNQAVLDLDVPVNVAGNAVGAVGGVAGAAATDSDAVVKEAEHDIATSGNGSLVGGNQLVGDADVPVNVAGNAVGAVAGVAGASSTGSDSKVVHQSAGTEAQSSALDGAPVVGELPEVPVSEMLPVGYDLSETAAQSVEEHAPERADELPEAAEMPSVDPVGDLLGAAGVGL
ncbi:hypothetical protein GCM10007079_02960 [Nocardiopsis terrae]|uniref:Chaplin domain-containing protein n=1 Tax=Nocardiopsis terrae TaxID=372655 RepID=A0ABR9HMY8_9ACTN|nr:hypothetical protein [Nocardiopsis terrae]MBE1460346.1 hypothetical protein [Nocardiopsis terrae]GHC70956.1 hypothetical protein GCM10007079_02960 [Nocardiopsis terrae]